MKKMFSILLMLAVALALSACDNAQYSNNYLPDVTTISNTTENTTATEALKEYPGNTGINVPGLKKELPDIVFTTTGEENGLMDTMYYIDGEVTQIGVEIGYPYFIVKTEAGDAWISDTSVKDLAHYINDSPDIPDSWKRRITEEKVQEDYPLPKIGGNVRVYAQYVGMSGNTNHASFIYGGLDYHIEVLLKCAMSPLMTAEIETDFVINGSRTDVLGRYATIKISKESLQTITMEEYAEFCTEVVDSSTYNWVSIICDDGTGIQFTDSDYIIATYGRINDEGVITKDLGYIRFTGEEFKYEPIP